MVFRVGNYKEVIFLRCEKEIAMVPKHILGQMMVLYRNYRGVCFIVENCSNRVHLCHQDTSSLAMVMQKLWGV